MSAVVAWLIVFAAACALVLVGLWVASVRQAAAVRVHLDGVQARLARHAAEPVPEPEASTLALDDGFTVSRVSEPTDGFGVPAVSPSRPREITSETSADQVLAMSGHHIATRETQMGISPFTQTDVPGGSLRWSLNQATRQIEQTGHELAVARNAGVVDPTVARRVLGHLVAAMTELDAVADMEVPGGQAFGGAR